MNGNTANRLRPQTFKELVGQDFVVSSLLGSLASDSINAHAFLLSGPRGVGKTSAARLIALALNRPGEQDIDTLDYKGSDAIRLGNSLDVIEIDGASYTSVENVRKIREEILYAPAEFKYKVYIIDEVHMLSHSAFNALLKTIEEPPSYVVFIFATTELDKVPLTIRSRCQRFTFHLITNDSIKQKLQEICKANTIDAEEEALTWMAKEARGSLRDAYTLFDQIHAFCGKAITKKAIDSNLGLTGLESLNTLFKLCVEGAYQAVQEHIHDLFEKGSTPEKILFESCEYFRDILLIKHNIQPKLLLDFDIVQFDANIYTELSTEQLEHALQLLLDCYRNLRSSIEPQFEIELLFNKLCGISNYASSNTLVQQLRELQAKLQYDIKQHDIEQQDSTQEKTNEHSPSENIRPPKSVQKEKKQTSPDTTPNTKDTNTSAHPPQTELSKNNAPNTAQSKPQENKEATHTSSTAEKRILEVFGNSTILNDPNEKQEGKP